MPMRGMSLVQTRALEAAAASSYELHLNLCSF